MDNPLRIAADGLSAASTAALSSGQLQLGHELGTLSLRLVQEAWDAEEQIADGLAAEPALVSGLRSALSAREPITRDERLTLVAGVVLLVAIFLLVPVFL